MMRIYDIRKIDALATALVIGIDLASGPDHTAYWHPPRKQPAPNPKKRAKVKAARKQRNRKP